MHQLAYWIFRWRSFCRWYAQAKTRYDLHAPFMADFAAAVLRDKRYFHGFGLVAQLRKYWARQSGEVPILSLGAPSKVSGARQRRIRDLVKKSAVPSSCGNLLFRTALWAQAHKSSREAPVFLLELGTNAGISTLYLHYANRRAQLHTIEGNPAVAALAQQTFQVARCYDTLRQHVGTFAEVLPRVLPQIPHLDLLFIDGDHRFEGTLQYLRACLPKAQENSVFIVADIHWSEDMEKAWEAAKTLNGVTASLDVYHFGLLFFKQGISPQQHLAYVATRWKPWRVGFF